MKVRELQEHISKLDPEMDVVCYSEDKRFLDERRGFILFDILAVSSTEAEQIRLDNGTPYLALERSKISVPIAILEVTAEF